jgi:hypothetical protein
MVGIDMAIIIPSSKTYDRQNPKVRDNIIERIEVSCIEVLPDNVYNEPVYNKSFYEGFAQEDFITDEDKYEDPYGYGIALYSFYKLKPTYLKNIELLVPKVSKNHYVEKIFNSYKIENDEKVPDIKVSIYSRKYMGTIRTEVKNYVSGNNYEIGYGTPVYGEPVSVINEISPALQYNFIRDINDYNITSNIDFDNKETISQPLFFEDNDFYHLQFTVFCGYEEIKGGGYNEYTNGSLVWTEQKSECVKIIPEKVEITIYGNTIGIDLADKTVYVNGETAKKVYSIDGNELMQTENYVDYTAENRIKLQLLRGLGLAGNGYAILASPNKEIQIGDNLYYNGESALVVGYGNEGYEVEIIVKDGGEFYNKIGSTIDCYLNSLPEIKNHIQDLFQNTAKKYSNGKETAVIRCSIGDYFDQYGSKVISIDNSTSRMIFDLYDEVIPMVYGADGKDKAMSFYNDGSPKVFQVLSRKPYYDGAVWQELTLQEVDKPN